MGLILSIIQIVLYVVPIIVLLLAVLLGFKRNIFQSIAKIVMTLIAITISALVVKFTTPGTIASSLPALSEVIGGEISGVLFNSSIGLEAVKIVAAVIMPITFTVIFAIVAFIFWILYCIPKKLLSDKKLEERRKKKDAKAALSVANDDIETAANEELDPAPEIHSEDPNARIGAGKTWLRVGSIVLSVLSAFLVLAHLALPICQYPQLLNDLSNVEIVESSTQDILPAVNTIANHPVVKCYSFASAPTMHFFDRISSTDGESDSARNTLNSLAAVTDILTSLEGSELNKETFDSLASLLESNPYLDNLILNAMQEMLAAWERGEAWLGIEQIAIGDDESFEMIYEHLSECDSAVSVFRLIGDALTLAKVSEDGFNQDTIETIIVDFSSDGISMVEKVLKESVSDNEHIPSGTTEKLASVSGALSAIEEIKNDSSIAEEEKKEILTNEAQAISNFYTIVTDPKSANPEQIGYDIAYSKTISDAILLATDNGNIKDPFDIAEKLPSSFLDSIMSGLKQSGASEELQKAVLAFFDK